MKSATPDGISDGADCTRAVAESQKGVASWVAST
jgi:hypothetical protein